MAIEQSTQSSNLVDVLETVLDKGVVIAGDIRVGIADVELLSIKIRLIVASVDKAKEIGMDWWETDPYLNSKAANKEQDQKLKEENDELQKRIEELEKKAGQDNRLV
ncbi:gas vesicle protein [Thalassobacillus sp. B23F22_16]|uniref:gas vesicle protein n=1 Tax=Thalassobacillus sp. B23F22_16 TaxID=3459513 RepID=UPI00373F1905